MMRWPKSKKAQVAISLAIALLSSISVLSQIVMKGFNDFYFGPRKSYPYPYATATDAQTAMWMKCGITFFLVFVILYALQQRFASKRRNST